jgi:hypothetical protein
LVRFRATRAEIVERHQSSGYAVSKIAAVDRSFHLSDRAELPDRLAHRPVEKHFLRLVAPADVAQRSPRPSVRNQEVRNRTSASASSSMRRHSGTELSPLWAHLGFLGRRGLPVAVAAS